MQLIEQVIMLIITYYIYLYVDINLQFAIRESRIYFLKNSCNTFTSPKFSSFCASKFNLCKFIT